MNNRLSRLISAFFFEILILWAGLMWLIFVLALLKIGCKAPPTIPDPPNDDNCDLTAEICFPAQLNERDCRCEDPPEPPHNPGIPFSWDGNTRGFLSFPATQALPEEVEAMHNRLKMAAWPRVTWHTCSETVEWQGTPWADSPYGADSPQNLDNLSQFLQVTADLGDQVLLDIFCTVRDNPSWMEANWERYVQLVTERILPYDHIAIHIANEPWHQNSWFRSEGNMRLVRTALRGGGYQGLIGADDNIGSPSVSFTYAYSWLDWPDFHPYRNPDPDFKELRRIQQDNAGRVVISEPTAYSTTRTGNCCTESKRQIRRYQDDAERFNIVWFYHSTGCGLGKNGERFDFSTCEWVPGEP